MNHDSGGTEFSKYFGATNVFKSPYLPINKTCKACDIETREEVDILSGELIEAFVMDDNIYVSDSLYEKIKINFSLETP